jgi:flagellin-like protein
MTKKINMAAIRLKVFIDSFLHQERGAVDIVAIVILIAIAVVLAVFFKEQIASLLKTIMKTIQEKAGGLSQNI